MKFSIIIIGKNEGSIIGRSIQSVIDGLRNLSAWEIVYVDSCSTDDSIEIAKHYPISILQLRPDWVHSPAAGRYTGYLNTTGTYIFFLDGDSLMRRGWIEDAMEYLRKHEHVAGVAGVIDEVYVDEHHNPISRLNNKYGQKQEVEKPFLLAGPAMYKRSVLEEVCPFNPFIYCEEEMELALRIRKAGYALHRLPIPMAEKYGPPRDSFDEITSKLNRNLYSQGMTWRYCLINGFFWTYAYERLGFVFQTLFALFSGAIIITIILIMKHFLLLCLLMGVVLIGFLVLAVKRRSVKRVLVSISKRLIITYKTIWTFFSTRTHKIEEYPADPVVIK